MQLPEHTQVVGTPLMRTGTQNELRAQIPTNLAVRRASSGLVR